MAREKKIRMTQSPTIIPYLNVMSIFDIQTGMYYLGEHGESILNGGYMPFMGIVAEENSGKSTLLNDLTLRAMSRHPGEYEFFVYDAENLGNRSRFQTLAQKYDTLKDVDFFDPLEMSFTMDRDKKGNVWMEETKQYILEKRDDKSGKMTLPFIDPHTKQHIESYVPSFIIADSFSAIQSDAVEKIMDKGEAGDSERNTLFMKDGLVKTQMLIELKSLLPLSANYFGTVVHVSSTVNMDGRPERKEMNYIRQGYEMKNVPAKFKSYTNVTYYIYSCTPLIAADKNGPQYPRNKEDDLRGDTDLMELTIIPLRNKQGKSGVPFKMVYSQSEGVQWSLSEYHFCKESDYYGIGGNKTTFFMELYPDTKLMRTTIRSKLDEDAKLRRAMEITAELCVMNNMWQEASFRSLYCSPAELYKDLKEMGYDWDQLLDTRGFWIYQEETHPQPFLSTMDLLRMRKGLYKPYWMK